MTATSILLAAAGLGTAVLAMLLLAARYRNGVWLVEIRDLLFIDFDESREFLSWTPQQLAAHGFRADSSEVCKRWWQRLSDVGYLTELPRIARLSNDVSKAQEIVRLFSCGGGDGCGSISELGERIRRIPDGYGCCSDHTEVFLALAALCGMSARETITSQHSINEFYDRSRGRWVFIDPQLAVMARGRTGAYLSLEELRTLALAGKPFVPEFFGGGDGHARSALDASFRRYYGGADALRRLRVTFGSNVFENDELRRRLRFLPKSVRQLIGHLSGVTPRYRMYVDRFNQDDLTLARRLRNRLEKPIRLLARGVHQG
jgi:hypothetical protein